MDFGVDDLDRFSDEEVDVVDILCHKCSEWCYNESAIYDEEEGEYVCENCVTKMEGVFVAA